MTLINARLALPLIWSIVYNTEYISPYEILHLFTLIGVMLLIQLQAVRDFVPWMRPYSEGCNMSPMGTQLRLRRAHGIGWGLGWTERDVRPCKSRWCLGGVGRWRHVLRYLRLVGDFGKMSCFLKVHQILDNKHLH